MKPVPGARLPRPQPGFGLPAGLNGTSGSYGEMDREFRGRGIVQGQHLGKGRLQAVAQDAAAVPRSAELSRRAQVHYHLSGSPCHGGRLEKPELIYGGSWLYVATYVGTCDLHLHIRCNYIICLYYSCNYIYIYIINLYVCKIFMYSSSAGLAK